MMAVNDAKVSFLWRGAVLNTSDFEGEIYCQNKPKCMCGLHNAANCISGVNNKRQKFMLDLMTAEILTYGQQRTILFATQGTQICN